MDTKKLRQKILDLAIHGKLVPQDPNDEPASVLLERIRAEKERLISEGKIKRSRKSAKTTDTHHYEQDVPFKVPSGWVWTIINEVGNIVTGSTPQKDIKEYYGGSIPFYKPNDLEQGINTLTAADHLSILGFEQSRKLPINSVLVTCIGATIGKTGRILKEGTCNQQINAVIHNQSINPLYLYYILVSEYFQHLIRSNASATTLPILNKSNFSKLRIPLPPLSEQQRIVEEIERWFKLIDIIEQGKADLQTTIKQAKNKILELAIHGKLVPQDPNDEPASELLKRVNPKAEITCDNGHYAQLPKGWSICELMDVAKIVTGSTPSKSNLSYYGGNFPLYRPSDLDAGRHTNTASEYLTTKGRDVSRIIPPNSIAVCCIGSIGKVGYIEQEGTTNQQINTAIPSLAIFPDYLYHLCTSTYFQNSLMEKSSAVTISIVNKSKMEHIKIPLPPKEEQARIVVAIDNLFNALDAVKENL